MDSGQYESNQHKLKTKGKDPNLDSTGKQDNFSITAILWDYNRQAIVYKYKVIKFNSRNDKIEGKNELDATIKTENHFAPQHNGRQTPAIGFL